MTTKQVETSITINTTARSIFICTTMNSYVQYFQRYIPLAFTIEGSRHPLPHPNPLSYLFHFLSFFFFFSLCEEVVPFPPYPAFIHFLSLYETVTPFPPYTVFIYFLSLYETVTPSPPYPAFIHFLSLYESVIPSPPYSAFIYSLSLTIRNSNSLPTLSPAFIYYAFIYYLWLYQPVTHFPPPPPNKNVKRSVANYTCKMIDKINITIIEHPISPLCFAEVEHAR